MTVHIEPRTMTNEAFYEFVNLPENELKTHELFYGVLYEMPSPSPLHGLIVVRIVRFLDTFVHSRKLGFVFADNNDFVLVDGLILKPDVAFVSKERLPKVPHRLKVAPDIAVEVISPSNTSYDIQQKIEAYFRHGVRLFWGVYPLETVVRVITPNPTGGYTTITLTVDDTLTGGDVLPGFSVAVRDLFPPEDLSDESDGDSNE
mgnify:CR=1 FL=1